MKKLCKLLCMVLVLVILTAAMSITVFAHNSNRNGNGLRLRDGNCRNITICVCVCINYEICPEECTCPKEFVHIRENRRNRNRVGSNGNCNRAGINNGNRGNNFRLLR